ncbi:MAG TPA: AMP-binding protein [Caulobacteraceae bacterium]|jgi:long-chain acyl-CoA synthetase|nr:AMP-binding protein [Caulobacteraceae bacterium]
MTTTESIEALAARVNAAAQLGMQPAVWAELQPDRVAIYDYTGQDRTFGELNANANRVARLLRGAGLQPGDSVALACSNRAEFCDVLLGALRVGMRCTPVNWHLTGDEIAYIVQDCEAKAFFADVRIAAAAERAAPQCPNLVLKVAIGGPVAGFADYDEALAPLDSADIADPVRGYTMLYTSGTTGRPKGVFKPGVVYGAFQMEADRERDIYLCTGPAYHAAPLAGNVRAPLMNGLPIVFLDRWDSEEVLRLIEARRITHSHFVPIMFQRLLALPAEVRAKYDVSSLKRLNHGAAPCPPEVKRAMIEWFGPVLSEYYAGSEGGAGFTVRSEEWLTKPGTVGRRPSPEAARIVNDAGKECGVGVAGTIYMRVPSAGFEYYKDQKKTEASRQGDYFTLGDIGYFDEDGYLFLTGRSAETIIAGGVNIYPQEVDNELIKHPAVEDSCTIGVPHDEYGEEVRAVIQLKPGYAASEGTRDEILAFAVANLAKFKVPRGLDFVGELPRSAAGKILRNRVREPYWAGRSRQI